MFFPVGEGWRGRFELWFPPAKAGASGQGMLIGTEHPLTRLSVMVGGSCSPEKFNLGLRALLRIGP